MVGANLGHIVEQGVERVTRERVAVERNQAAAGAHERAGRPRADVTPDRTARVRHGADSERSPLPWQNNASFDLVRARPALERMIPHPSTTQRSWRTSDFDFELPPELIAQHPTPERSASRLLDGRTWPPVDRTFRDLPALLQPGDLLVFNDTQVVKARLFGEKPSGGKLELLIERVLGDREVVAHMKVSKKPTPGTVLRMAIGADGQPAFTATLLGRWPDADGPLFRLRLSDDPYTLMERHGHVPLPPYIEHADTPDDAQRYQTVFAKNPGAVAAPTAALHFDEGGAGGLGSARGAHRLRHAARGRGHVPARQGRGRATASHAQRVVPHPHRDAGGARAHAPRRRAHRRGRHHHGAHAGELGAHRRHRG
jgi:hypothetical protein